MRARSVAIAFTLSCAVAGAMAGPDTAHAFDGRRSGFVLGFGVGLAGAMGESIDLSALATELRLGVGIGQRVMLHYSGKQLWPTVLFPAVGVSYYVRDIGPSVAVRAGMGVSASVVSTEEFDREDHNPLSLFAGVGYEFLPHYCIEVEGFRLGWVEDEGDRWGVAVLVSALAY